MGHQIVFQRETYQKRCHPSTARHAATKDRSSVGPVVKGVADAESAASLDQWARCGSLFGSGVEGGGWPLARDERNRNVPV